MCGRHFSDPFILGLVKVVGSPALAKCPSCWNGFSRRQLCWIYTVPPPKAYALSPTLEEMARWARKGGGLDFSLAEAPLGAPSSVSVMAEVSFQSH